MTRWITVTARRRWLGGVLVLLLLCGLYVLPAGAPLRADPVGPTARDRQITLTVASLLRKDHLSKHAIDDEASQRCLKAFLKMLDPWKLYFIQADADEFSKHQNDLDDWFRRGDVTYAYTIFNTFLRRIDERVHLVDELLAAKHDFTVDEEMLIDRKLAEYAKDEAEVRDRWRKRIKFDLLMLKSDAKEKIEGQAAIDKLTRRYHSFAKRMHQTDGEELLEMYLTSMTSSLDPHTSYMSPRNLENFEIMMRLELEGIGAALKSEDGYTVVEKIIPGGAAEKEGHLKVADRIIGVGQGTDGAIEDVVDMKLSDVVDKIRGKKGTIVRLEATTGATGPRKTVQITRAKIELKDGEAQFKIFPAGKKPDGTPFRIGVIDLPSFYMDMSGAKLGLPDFRSTTRDVRKILESFNADPNGVDAVLLDLRRNGGGSLQEAINLTGLFTGEGPVVQVKDSEGRVQPYDDNEPGPVWKGPLVVLISKFSASASEILAGAIQDYRRGLIVGDHSTHGKGTVQSLVDLGHQLFRVPNATPLGALKITMQQFYRPNGDSTQKRGVLADIELPSVTTHLDVAEADLDYPVAFDQVPRLEFKKFNMVDKAVLDRLAATSLQRVNGSQDFQKVLKNISRYKTQKERKYVTLNEKKFMEERAEMNADKEEEKQIEKMSESSTTGVERTFYLDEAMAIATDYLQMFGQRRTNVSAQTGPVSY